MTTCLLTNQPTPKSLPSSTPAKADAHRVYVACISNYEKLRGPGINQTGCRRKHSLFCAIRIFHPWLIYGMCLIWVRRTYPLSAETFSWFFLAPWLSHTTQRFFISRLESRFVILDVTHVTVRKSYSKKSVIKRPTDKWINKRLAQSVI